MAERDGWMTFVTPGQREDLEDLLRELESTGRSPESAEACFLKTLSRINSCQDYEIVRAVDGRRMVRKKLVIPS